MKYINILLSEYYFFSQGATAGMFPMLDQSPVSSLECFLSQPGLVQRLDRVPQTTGPDSGLNSSSSLFWVPGRQALPTIANCRGRAWNSLLQGEFQNLIQAHYAFNLGWIDYPSHKVAETRYLVITEKEIQVQ